MTQALIALVISVLDVVEIWTQWSPGIDHQWIETLLMVLNPILIWMAPPGGWPWAPKWPARGA